jgi:ribosome biogenesis GTPase
VAPVVVLNKTDVCAEVARRRQETEAVAAGVAVLTVSAATGGGLETLAPHLHRGHTLLLTGSSGVGKSTLVNRLVGRDVALTRPVRQDDDRGRHTTVRSELIVLPGGALLVDTPGLRELQLWSEAESLDVVFDDVAAWAAGCRFRDCRHAEEPGCAVRGAVDRGALPSERLEAYRKLQSELDRLRVRQDQWARLAEKRRWRSLHRAAKAFRPRR